MSMNMGGKIRQLRKQKGVSQEVLAQYLGLSFQAVSKWENGTTLPDVTLIPALASFFGVSTDELFSFNRLETEKRIEKIVGEAAALRWTEPDKAEAILREGLRKYPGNDILLNNLLYVLRGPERREEAVTLCRSLIEGTKDDCVKYDACRILAQAYRDMGETALCRQTLEMIPEIYFTKLECMATMLEGAEALDAADRQAQISRDDLLAMLARMSQLYREQGDEARAADYAGLTRRVHAAFEDRRDGLSYDRGLRQEWLRDEVWPRLAGDGPAQG